MSMRPSPSLAKHLAAAIGICLCLHCMAGRLCCSSSSGANVLVNGYTCSPDIYWEVTLKAGTVGSLFDDPLGPVATFRYETVVMVDGKEKKVIPGGTWSSNMGDSSYTVQIPLKDLGLLDPNKCGTYYLTAFTRNYEGSSTIDTGYSILYDDITITTSLPPPPELGALILKGIMLPAGHTSVKKTGFLVNQFFVAGSNASAEVEVINFDERFYSFGGAVLIGDPHTVGTEKHELTGSFNGSNNVTFNSLLRTGKGFHGRYFWQVKADFVNKVTGKTITVYSNNVYEPVFFDKYGQDDRKEKTPNWFTYWKKDGACPSLKNKKVSYDQDSINGDGRFGSYLEKEDTAYLCASAAEQHYDVTYVYESPQHHEFSGPYIWGIYSVEEVVAHELSHRERLRLFGNIFNGHFLSGNKDYHKPREYLVPVLELRAGQWAQVEKNKIEYHDHLLDAQETQDYKCYQLDENNCDTYSIGSPNGDSNGHLKGVLYQTEEGEILTEYAAYGDDEFLAMMAANQATDDWRAVLENDWAFPGEQSCVPIAVDTARKNVGWPKNRQGRAEQLNVQKQAFGAKQSISRHVVSEAQFETPAIVLNGVYKEMKQDDASARVSEMCYKLGLKVSGLHELRLSGVMTDLKGNVVAHANSAVSNKSVSAELRFQSADIYESGIEGPFRLDRVKLMVFDGNDVSDLGTLSEFKDAEVALCRSDLARNDAYVLDVANEAVATNGIVVSVNTEINTPGVYEIAATLAGTSGVHVSSCRLSTNCVQGTNCFDMVFAANEILESDIDGPYVVDNIVLYKDGMRVDSRLDFYTLRKKYHAAAFDFAGSDDVDSDEFMSQFEDYVPPAEMPPPERFWVFFNPNGGTVSETTREVKGGEMVGALPLPILGNDEFLGWYTEPEGGILISDSTVVTTNVVWHAHWKEIPDPIPQVEFASSELSIGENGTAIVRVIGGNADKASSVDVYLTYNTAVSADVDLAKGMVDGVAPKGGLKFPLALTWAKGEAGEKVITIPVKTDKTVEGDEFFTLQLANAQGIALGEVAVCTVTIKDTNTFATLQDGVMNPNIKVSTSGDGKWIAGAGSRSDEDGSLGLFHVESPTLAKGKKSTLSFGTLKGAGEFSFCVRFSGDPNEEIPSSLAVYNGKTLLGTLNHTQVSNVWDRWYIDATEASSRSSHSYSFVFTQGSDPNTHAEVSDILWDDGNSTSVYNVWACADGTDGGYVSGSGPYIEGQTAKLVAKPLPGWMFDGWYRQKTDGETGETIYGLWNAAAATSYKVTKGLFVTAFFSKIPYVRGLADPADGGKVSGSGLCARGKKVTLKATANKNFTFLGWGTGNGELGTGNGEWGTGNGFVATTASLVIDRSAKPAKDSKTSTTLTNVAEDVTFYAVFKSDPEIFVTVDATDGTGAEPTGKGAGKYVAGTITGMGKYAPGKTKIALKAAANKGYVFAGWLDANGELLTKDATYTIAAMGESDVAYTAQFVTSGEDKESIKLSVAGEDLSSTPASTPARTNFCGVAMSWRLAADALSATTVKVSGLPSGLKFTAKDILKKGSKTEVEIPANTIYGAPTAASKVDKKTGAVTPAKVVFTVTTAGKSSQTFALNLYIEALPAWAVGTFDGAVFAGDSVEASGIAQAFTVAANGKISGKLLRDDGTWVLAADSFSSVEVLEPLEQLESLEQRPVFHAIVIGKNGKLLETNDVTVAADGVSGRTASEPSVSWTAYQNLWKRADTKADMPVIKKDIKVDYELVPGDVNNKLTLTFKKDGAVAFAGKVGGTKVSGSSQLVLRLAEDGLPYHGDGSPYQVTLYVPPKTTAKPPVESWCKTFAVTLTVDELTADVKVEVAAE